MMTNNETIFVNGKEYLLSLITEKDYYWGTRCKLPILIEEINSVPIRSTSTMARKELSKLDGMRAWDISHNRWRAMVSRLYSSLETFRYRTCDRLALVVKVDTPEYRALRRAEKILPSKVDFYKAGTHFGMQPKEDVNTYWVYINY